MSGHLARLRTHFGDSLLVRRGSEYQLTPLAQRLMETLPDVLLGAERLMAAQSGFDPLTSDHSFVIFASDYASARVGAALLKVFEREAPHVHLTFAAVLTSVVDGAPETLRSSDGIMLPHGYFSRQPHLDLIHDTWVFIAAAENEAISDTPSAEDLLEAPWITTVDGAGAFTPPSRQLHIAGADPKITMVAPSFFAIPEIIIGSRHVALIQRSVAEGLVQRRAGLRIVEPPFSLAPIREALWWHRDREHEPAHAWLRRAMHRALIEPDRAEDP
jgi:DNA-binding transcriptional LysR family regulator